MNKIALIAGLAVAATGASADVYSHDFAVDSIDSGIVADHTFALGEVASIKSVSLDLAQTWGGDFQITLTHVASGATFVLMFGEVDQGFSGNFDMGLAAGDASLANVATYTFIETGGVAVYDDTAGFVAGDTFNANSWGAAGPYAAGDWNLLVNDGAAGDPSSLGRFSLDFNAVPAPGSMALLGLGGIVAGRRRR